MIRSDLEGSGARSAVPVDGGRDEAGQNESGKMNGIHIGGRRQLDGRFPVGDDGDPSQGARAAFLQNPEDLRSNEHRVCDGIRRLLLLLTKDEFPSAALSQLPPLI